MTAIAKRNKPSALASKSVLAAYKLDQKTEKNSVSVNEIVAEVKKVRKLRTRNGTK